MRLQASFWIHWIMRFTKFYIFSSSHFNKAFIKLLKYLKHDIQLGHFSILRFHCMWEVPSNHTLSCHNNGRFKDLFHCLFNFHVNQLSISSVIQSSAIHCCSSYALNNTFFLYQYNRRNVWRNAPAIWHHKNTLL